jgi:hypothetical protein
MKHPKSAKEVAHDSQECDEFVESGLWALEKNFVRALRRRSCRWPFVGTLR